MTDPKPNLAASIAARLLNRARKTGDDFQVLLTNYCFERFLHRLGESDARRRFVLKGAMLLRVWSDQPYRATRDLDLLRRGDASFDAIRTDIDSICAGEVQPDGVTFDAAAAALEEIRVEAQYGGVRALLPARSGKARLVLQIDIGIGDSVWPSPRLCSYPGLLDLPEANVFAYPRETVVAEKLEAIVVLGDRNSRIKDFFDLHHLASTFEFDRATLSESVRRTFARRRTPMPEQVPIGLTPDYWANPSRPAQVRAFARRSGLGGVVSGGADLAAVLTAFLLPVLADAREGRRVAGSWAPGGPWR